MRHFSTSGTVEIENDCAPRRVKIKLRPTAKATAVADLVNDWILHRQESPFSNCEIALPNGWESTLLNEARKGNSDTIWLIVPSQKLSPAEIDGRIRSGINRVLGNEDRFIESLEVTQ